MDDRVLPPVGDHRSPPLRRDSSHASMSERRYEHLLDEMRTNAGPLPARRHSSSVRGDTPIASAACRVDRSDCMRTHSPGQRCARAGVSSAVANRRDVSRPCSPGHRRSLGLSRSRGPEGGPPGGLVRVGTARTCRRRGEPSDLRAVIVDWCRIARRQSPIVSEIAARPRASAASHAAPARSMSAAIASDIA